MNDEQQTPACLKVVAWLFILSGISALIEIIVSAARGHASINFGVIAIFIGAGLLRLSATWRRWALVFIWIALIGAPIVAVVILASPGSGSFMLFGQKVGEAPQIVGVCAAAVVFLIALWQSRMPTRPDVRALFGRASG